jgi:ketosteroid isomerase-like protein
MATETVSANERVAIIQECNTLIHRFAERNDARDVDAVAALFVEDAVFIRPTAPDKPVKGREAIREQLRARPPGRMTRHICANTVVTVVGPEEATATSYVLLFTAENAEGAALPVPADPRQLLGAYQDRFVRDRDGIWKFKERVGSLAMSIG